MFITPQEVMDRTPYTDITTEQVRQAQYIIEMYVGKTESQVDSPSDKAILARATAAQCVYMRDNPDMIFNQIKSSSINEGGQMVTFQSADDAPFIAPLAVIACRKLSWKGSRSVTTGRWHQRHPRVEWARD